MPTILTTNNAQIFRQLGSPQFRSAPIDHEIAASGAAVLEAVRRASPALVILDLVLPDASGFDVCAKIKSDPRLAATRVMLLLDNPSTREQLQRAQQSHCDDILCLPAPTDELYGHVAPLLGFLESDSRRMQEKLFAELDLGKRRVRAEVLDINDTGARLRIGERVAPPAQIPTRLWRSVTGATHTLAAAIIWQRQPPGRRDWEAGLKYPALDPDALARLRASCLWEVTSTESGALAVLQGDFVESVDFAPLLERLIGERRIEMDLSRVRRLNSVGALRWAEVVHALRGRELSFLRCSLEFTSHAAMTTGMLGDGKVESLFAPYACAACSTSELRLLQIATLLDGADLRPPVLRCAACGGDLEFDDIPERYFSFLLT